MGMLSFETCNSCQMLFLVCGWMVGSDRLGWWLRSDLRYTVCGISADINYLYSIDIIHCKILFFKSVYYDFPGKQNQETHVTWILSFS
jgi:hypothetical protein